MPKVTAIVSAYYAEKYIHGRFQNLLEQAKNVDLEVITVLQQDSVEHDIIESMIPMNIDGIVITTPDIPTLYKAWNMAIEEAAGEYIANANCDDRYYPGALSSMANALDTHKDAALVFGNMDIKYSDSGKKRSVIKYTSGRSLLSHCFIGPFPMWRRSIHEKHGYFDDTMEVAGDYEFWLRLYTAKERFYYINQTIGVYLHDKQSLEHRKSKTCAEETHEIKARYTALAEGLELCPG